jgi:hypothetical protein
VCVFVRARTRARARVEACVCRCASLAAHARMRMSACVRTHATVSGRPGPLEEWSVEPSQCYGYGCGLCVSGGQHRTRPPPHSLRFLRWPQRRSSEPVPRRAVPCCWLLGWTRSSGRFRVLRACGHSNRRRQRAATLTLLAHAPSIERRRMHTHPTARQRPHNKTDTDVRAHARTSACLQPTAPF